MDAGGGRPVAGKSGDGRPERRAPRQITPDYKQRAAMYYLERYAAPAAQLRRVLAHKISVSCRHHGLEAAAFEAMLDEVVARCVASGLVDDQRFAEVRAAALQRKGRSARAVAASLSAKGVARDLAATASLVSEEDELGAARKTARRKRLGPWTRGDRAASRQKDLTALARAGFPLTIARAVIDGAGDEDVSDC